MTRRRVVPDITSDRFDASREFYADFLGFDVGMDMVINSIEVDDVDRVHALAVERGLGIVYPLTDEPWGVRRFFVTDPNGVILNILSHQARPGSAEP
jgi:uncharacterized glyoxalase superfamily protein PhnB